MLLVVLEFGFFAALPIRFYQCKAALFNGQVVD
jgi:hypothetical protein